LSLEDTAVLALVALPASLGGAFFGSWASNRFELRSSQRRSHSDDIKERCLKPLSKDLGDFYVSEIWFDELRPAFSTAIAEPDVLQGSLKAVSYATKDVLTMRMLPYELDTVLYSDLKSHYPELAKALTEFDSGLGGKFELFKRETYTLFSKLYKMLSERGVPIVTDEARAQRLAKAIFYAATNKPSEYWPNLYNQVSTERALVEVISSREEVKESAEKILRLQTELTTHFRSLSEFVDVALDSYKSLRGSCRFID
jgi:hypothetical protein